MAFYKNREKIVNFILQPTRIIIIIFLLSQLLSWKIPWESATIIFYGFIAIFVGSYFSEAIIIHRINEFHTALKELYTKYVIHFPLEFVGVYIHTLLSFLPDSDTKQYWETIALVIAVSNAVVIEAYYYFVVPKLKNKKIDDRRTVLIIIALSVMIFILMLFSCFTSGIC